MATDYRTYPGDRPTRHTPAQREAKVTKARRLLEEAAALLGDVAGDYEANSYRLGSADWDTWRTVATATDTTRNAIRNLTQE